MSIDPQKKLNKIVLIIALQLEAEPIITALKMKKIENAFDKRLPLIAYQTDDTQQVILVSPGICPINKIDRIGTQAATLAAWESIRLFKPDLIINAGTAGGFKNQQAEIGDVFMSTESFKYHNRHIALRGFEQFEIGCFKCLEMPRMAAALNFKKGIVSTGDSVHADPSDLEKMKSNKAQCKEMEAAAIAEIAELCEVPMIALKVITDFIDHHEKTDTQFFRNYKIAVQALTEKVQAALRFIHGKTVAEL